MSPLLKNLLIALGITLTLSVGYLVVGRSATPDAPIGGGSTNQELMNRSQEILNNTNKIDGYHMDTSILQDVRFRSLANTRVDLNALNVQSGRSNPFAPAP